MFLQIVLMALLMIASSTLSAATEPLNLQKREHPFLFATKQELERAADRAERLPWARAAFDSIIKSADNALSVPLAIPPEGGQWSHYYACEICGDRLTYKDGKHICRRCKREYSGWPYDQVRYNHQHTDNFSNAKNLALAAALTGNERYAERAKETLLAYARIYESLPYHDYKGGTTSKGARISAQTLDESVKTIGIAWTYDLIYNSLSAEDRALIENQLLRPLAVTILRNDMGISNWQSWHNAALAAIGFCIRDEQVAHKAIRGKSGLEFQLQNSILSDGFWYEGSAAYHFYALSALQWNVLAATRAGYDNTTNPNYRAMYEAPLSYTFPDLTMPAVNDSSRLSLKEREEAYDFAYGTWADPEFARVLEGAKRDSVTALLWGADDIPSVTAEPLRSQVYAGLGAVMLRQGTTQPLCLHLDYGTHGGGHGHYDKLAIILFAQGQELAPDPGALLYSVPLHSKWYKRTVAHNTVAIDQRGQKASTGTLTIFHDEPGFAVAQARCSEAYEDVELIRTCIATPDYALDIFSCRSSQPRTFDYIFHHVGKVKVDLTMDEMEKVGERDGYEVIKSAASGKTAQQWHARFRSGDAHTHFTVAGEPDTEVIQGIGFTGRTVTECPLLIARRRANDTDYIALIQPTDRSAKSLQLEVIQNGDRRNPMMIVVRGENVTDTYTLELAEGPVAALPSVRLDRESGQSRQSMRASGIASSHQ